jgi:glycosyltransferase involved in cell wall biosynthesis
MTDFFKTPLHFCVLIPCYNDMPGLVQALQSIRYDAATFAVVIVDDGSTVPVDTAFLQDSIPHIQYLHVICLPKNEGITTALNTGLQWILQNTNAPYIARLDCGDTCHPQRFQKQVTFLNTHTEVGLLGSWCTFREEGSGRSYTYTTPLQHAAIIKAMHLRNVFIHPAVMFRTALLKDTGLYPYNFPHAEDYAFFWKLLQVTQGAILSEILMCCEIRQSGISFANRRKQLWSRGKVIRAFGSSVVLKVVGMLKLYILLLMPNALLLRLKTGRAAV